VDKWFFLDCRSVHINTIIFYRQLNKRFGRARRNSIYDGFISALVKDVSPGAGMVFRAIGFGLDFLFAGLFVVCGMLGRKKFPMGYYCRMVLYGF